mgnify:CR=1 FL=1
MDYPKVCLRRGEEAGVLKGQKLIYDNELDWADDICTDGCVVDVLDSRQRFVARGFFNARSKLTVRVLTRRAEETIDRDFFARRIRAVVFLHRLCASAGKCVLPLCVAKGQYTECHQAKHNKDQDQTGTSDIRFSSDFLFCHLSHPPDVSCDSLPAVWPGSCFFSFDRILPPGYGLTYFAASSINSSSPRSPASRITI